MTADGRSTPHEVLNSVVQGINTGNLESLMTLYDPLSSAGAMRQELGTYVLEHTAFAS